MSDEKPLPPSQKKLRDARQRGEIVKSQEVTQMASLTALLLYGWAASSQGLDSVMRVFALLDELGPAMLTPDGLVWFITQAFSRIAFLLIILAVLPVAFGIFGGLMQSGWLIAFEPLAPKFERLNPVQNLKNMFTLTKLADVVRRLAKSLLIFAAIWWLSRRMVVVSVTAPDWPTPVIVALIARSLLELVTIAAVVFLLGAVLDYVLQRIQFMKQQGMSHDEVKREYKELEGDPHLRGKRKSLQREMVNTRMVDNARTAQVLVTNPTHVAVALQYGDEEAGVPVVSAKGLDHMALRMKEAARSAGVPIYEDVPLARKLYRLVEVDEAIGRELFEPVADVLVWVEKLQADAASPSGVSEA
jgi:type III secretion protein U